METPFALAVRFIAWLEVTVATLALKPALLAPAGTTTDAGTLAAVLLLDRLTVWPPVGAVEFNDTVQEDVAGPTRELLAHTSVLTTEVPAPLRETTFVGLP